MPVFASTLRNHAHRWWTYQRERFPLHAHGPLVAAFSLAAVGFSAALRGTVPSLEAAGTAFIVGLAFFWLLRVADEFKDADEDRRHRPHRPVPRGLVSLRELGVAALVAAALQLGCVLALTPALLPLLFVAWGYLGLMSAEFFAPRWLSARPGLYLLTHAGITPLIALVCSACDWRAAGAGWPAGLKWLLGAALFSSLAIEVGRKMRAPSGEIPGVATYTKAWGRRRAVAAWLGTLAGAVGCALGAARRIGDTWGLGPVFGILLLGAAGAAGWFLLRPVPQRARLLDGLSGALVLALYGGLGMASFF